MPKISVVMTAYNDERFVSEAIQSILNQTFTDFEFIIVNDGSTDKTLACIRSFSDERIVLIDQENRGLAAALNAAIDRARGKYIARMDADDISYPNRIEVQYTFMEDHPEVFLCGSNMSRFGYSKGIGVNSISFKNNAPWLLFQNPVAHPTWFFRREGEYILRYDEHFRKSQDMEAMYCMLVAGVCVVTLPDVLLAYRERNRSGELADKQYTDEVQKKVLKLLHINASDRMMERMNLFRGMHKGSFEALFCEMKVLYRWILFQNKRYHIFDQAALYKVLKEMERYTLSVNV